MNSNGGHMILVDYNHDLKFSIDFDQQRFNRIPHSDAALESRIEQVWNQKVSSNPTLFNASKFRLSHISQTTFDTYVLHLGLTDYKTYQGTHMITSLFPAKNRALPLGNVVIVETLDNFFPVLVRSAVSGEGCGACVFPGGHPEPEHINNFDVESITKELWESAYREMIEELFLEKHQVVNVQNMTCLGIIARRFDNKASMVFYVQIPLSCSQLENIYNAFNDGVESIKLMFLSNIQLEQVVSNELIDQTYHAMPEMTGSIQLLLKKLNMESNRSN